MTLDPRTPADQTYTTLMINFPPQGGMTRLILAACVGLAATQVEPWLAGLIAAVALLQRDQI